MQLQQSGMIFPSLDGRRTAPGKGFALLKGILQLKITSAEYTETLQAQNVSFLFLCPRRCNIKSKWKLCAPKPESHAETVNWREKALDLWRRWWTNSCFFSLLFPYTSQIHQTWCKPMQSICYGGQQMTLCKASVITLYCRLSAIPLPGAFKRSTLAFYTDAWCVNNTILQGILRIRTQIFLTSGYPDCTALFPFNFPFSSGFTNKLISKSGLKAIDLCQICKTSLSQEKVLFNIGKIAPATKVVTIRYRSASQACQRQWTEIAVHPMDALVTNRMHAESARHLPMLRV